jgi:hypothetical protein
VLLSSEAVNPTILCANDVLKNTCKNQKQQQQQQQEITG